MDTFERLSVRSGWKTAEACRQIGISRSLFYELRDGKREVTAKMEARLREAEREAGMGIEREDQERDEHAEPSQLSELSERLERLESLLEQVLTELREKHDAGKSSKVRGKKFA